MNATAIMTTTTKLQQQIDGQQAFLNGQDLPANAPRPTVEAYERAAREYEWLARNWADRFNADL